MRIGRSYKQHRDLAERWDAIVIGSGIGGLSVAATMAKIAGTRVLVLERHYTAGGFTHTFRRPGYEWDVGVHYIGEVSTPGKGMRRAFDFITDGQLDWADMGDVYDRFIIDGRAYDYVKGRERWRETMHGYFPNETRAIDRYLEKVEQASRKAQLFFAEKVLPAFVATMFGGLMRRPLLKEARVTTRDVLESLTQNQELIGVLTAQYGDYGLVPAESSFFVHAMMFRHFIRGAAYPVGGSSRIASTILPVIEAAGGEVVTNAEVAEILVEDGRAVGVKLSEDGRELRAPVVISDAGVRNTFGRLLPADLAEQKGLKSKIDVIEPSVAHLSLYLGLEGTSDELGLNKTNLWIYPSPHHEQNVQRFREDKNAPLPGVYLSFPSAKDPDFNRRCPGRSTIEVITFTPYEWFKPWEDTGWKKRGAEYEELKAGLSERLLGHLYDQVPSTRGRVDIAELSTPLSTKNFANHPSGEIYGLAHTPGRFEQRWLQPRTPIKGLYLTGADVCSAGLVGAFMGGLLCSSAVLGRNVLGTVMQHKTQTLREAATAPQAPSRTR
jgi:all-trans-retinol 13,14-reductase